MPTQQTTETDKGPGITNDAAVLNFLQALQDE